MLKTITLNLSKEFKILSVITAYSTSVFVYHNEDIIGEARVTTDKSDVLCVTYIHLLDEYVDTTFFEKYTLSQILLKFIMKLPSLVRKPEFSFILEVPENMKSLISAHDFNQGEDSDVQNEILIRKDKLLPSLQEQSKSFVIRHNCIDSDFPKLFSLLKKNAYWQENLTIDRLKILLESSKCFIAESLEGVIIGFSRVLTDNITFASLWDVVVDEDYRGQGVATLLMHSIFSDETLNNIHSWVIFTDTAKDFYRKFGFVSESEIPNRKLVHKLRLQNTQPNYMFDLIQHVPKEEAVNLNISSTFKFLFSDEGKRANLAKFWQNIPIMQANQKHEISYRYGAN